MSFSGSLIRDGGGSNLHIALQSVMEHLHPSTGNRAGVPTVVIVFADGSWDLTAAENAARDLKNEGATVIVIGVGNSISQSHINAIASDPHFNNAFYIDKWFHLPRILTAVQTAACGIPGKRCQ